MATRAAGLATALLAAVLAGPAAALVPAHLVAGFPRGQVILETAGPRCLLIDVYLPASPAQRAQGLMFVEAMDEFEGMYFAHAEPAELVMWMKNTRLSLDMVFVRTDGAIATIERDTEPYSLRRISSGGPVVGVLELKAGFAARWRVTPGTRLQVFGG